MSPFDYLSVLVSIVLGLAIATILTRLAAVVTARERVDFYWPPIAWAIWLFFISAQHWWAEWEVRRTTAWTFADFWLLLLVPVVLFLLASLVLPEREEDGKLDLSEWYFRNRPWFFGLMFFVPILSIAEEVFRSGHMASNVNLAFLLLFDAVVAVAYVLKSRRAQEWITAQAMVMTLVYVAALYSRLPQH